VPPVTSSFAEAILTYQAIQLSDGMRAHLATRVADLGTRLLMTATDASA